MKDRSGKQRHKNPCPIAVGKSTEKRDFVRATGTNCCVFAANPGEIRDWSPETLQSGNDQSMRSAGAGRVSGTYSIVYRVLDGAAIETGSLSIQWAAEWPIVAELATK